LSKKVDDAVRPIMPKQPNNKRIHIMWEHHQDSDSAQLVRRAVELILAEMEPDITAQDFDKVASPEHA
jgi:hypothetical protein